MTKRNLAMAIALTLALPLAACHRDASERDGGGGGPREVVPSEKLPESNNVNPSATPDSYIDDRAERQHGRDR